MHDPEAVQIGLRDPWSDWTIIVAGARRERSGNLVGDAILSNGKPTYAARAVLNVPDGRRAWVEEASGTGRPDPDILDRAIIEMLPDLEALVQEPKRRAPSVHEGVRPLFPQTEWGNAQRMVAQHGEDLRWCAE